MLQGKSSVGKEIQVVGGRADTSFPQRSRRRCLHGPCVGVKLVDESRHMLCSCWRKIKEWERSVSSDYLRNCIE